MRSQHFREKSKLGSISTTFYKQMLHAQISKARKDTDDLTVFFMLLGSACAKAAHKTLVKLTPVEEEK